MRLQAQFGDNVCFADTSYGGFGRVPNYGTLEIHRPSGTIDRLRLTDFVVRMFDDLDWQEAKEPNNV